jgi:hypothetical protein
MIKLQFLEAEAGIIPGFFYGAQCLKPDKTGYIKKQFSPENMNGAGCGGTGAQSAEKLKSVYN